MQHNGTVISRIAVALSTPVSVQRAMHDRLGGSGRRGTGAPFIEPGNKTEEWLSSLWCQVLRLGRVSIEDNYFELGGNSLQATQIIAQIRKHFGVKFSLNVIFEYATIAALACEIEQACKESGQADHEIIEVCETRYGVPSYAQQRLYFLHRWEPEAPTYNIAVAFTLRGLVDHELLEECLSELVVRHDMLSTVFTVEGNKVIATAGRCRPQFSMNDFGHEGDGYDLESAMSLEARKSFDLQNGPLLRVTAFRLDKRETVLLFCMHHIISDGWSLGVLLRELSRLYDARIADKAALLPDIPIRYSDYANWQRQWLEGRSCSDQLGYWRHVLSGQLPLLDLPTDRPRPATRSSGGDVCRFQLGAELREDLEALCREHDVTLFMGLLAAFYVLIHRYSGQDDIVVGTPIANRNHNGTEELIGFFVNTLALRANLSGDISFSELLLQVKSVTLGAYANQDVPFDQVVNELNLERDLSRTPVFQVMFVFQNAQQDTLRLAGVKASPLHVHTATSKFDLTLEITETELGLDLVWEYDIALFDVESIEAMHKSWVTLLGSLRQQCPSPVSRLPILDPVEQLRLEQEAGADLVTARDSSTLVDLFEAQVRTWPARTAVNFGLNGLDYQALNCAANRLASHLLNQGVEPGNLVGLCVDRSMDLVISILGILKAGAAYVPLDPVYPKDRIEFMMDDAGVEFVVTNSSHSKTVNGEGRKLVLLDDDSEIIGRCDDRNPRVATDQAHLAYVIYTSGSTGQPKGVAIPHGNVIRLFSSTDSWFGFNEYDTWALFHSYAFDFTVWELWGALLHGGRLVVVPFETTRSPEAFRQLLLEERVTVLNQTPTAFAQLMHADSESNAAPGDSALRYVIFGGEALEFGALRPWFDRHGDQKPQLINMYGITETTVHVTWRPITREDVYSSENSAIGIPLPDLHCVVLDTNGQLLPAGVAGELHVGGAGLARGYLNRPGLTAQRFVPNPYSSRPGERLYRTGDLVRKLRDGSLDYLGRIDHQVQLRGFRIELGEIEAALSSMETIQDSVVLLTHDEDGVKQLAAYLVVKETPSIVGLRDALREKLPGYMIPSTFNFLDHFPLTPNGKLDKSALPAPNYLQFDKNREYVAARSESERVMVEIWQDILQIGRIGVRDSFFALGGDSIKSIPVLAAMRDRGIDLSLLQLFQEETIERLARIADQRGVRPEQALPEQSVDMLVPADRERLPDGVVDAYPVSMLQAGMLFHMQRAPDSGIYHNVTSSTLRVDFSLEAFREAVRRVVARHAVFRTSFDITNYTEPLQLVHETADVQVEYEDISNFSWGDQEAFIDDWIPREKNRLFDITVAPLIRFTVMQRSENLIQFTITECHILLDGWSENSTLSELWDLHFSLVAGGEVPVHKPPSYTYHEFVAFERQIIRREDYKEFWQDQLAEFELAHLPRWPGCYRNEKTSPVCSPALWVPDQLFKGLKRSAIGLGMPLKSILLAAHLKVISGITGTRSVVSGLVTHGRPDCEGGESVRGLFLNTIPLCMKLAGGSWSSLVQDVHRKERELFPYRQYPMAQIKKNSGQDSLFESAFGYVNFHVMERLFSTGKMSGVGEVRRWTPTDFPLMVVFMRDPASDRLGLTLDYDEAVLGREQVDSVGRYYMGVLDAMVRQPEARYEDYCLLPEDERRHLVISRNQTANSYPDGATVHELFDRQAIRTPDSIALVEESGSRTYEELRSGSNQLANYLVQTGIKPGDRVGVCMQRSLACVASILAILKAGGSYVPLDPDYPGERLAFMARDAKLSVVLTEQAWESRLTSDIARTVCLDRLSSEISDCSRERPVVDMDSTWMAYVMYTSGSTGTPKGIEVPHKAIVRLVIGANYVSLGESETLLMLAPISFDASTFEIWGSLLTGAKLAVLPGSISTLEEIGDAVRRYQVSTLWLTAGLFHQFVDERLDALSPLAQLLSGGDVLSVPHVMKVKETLPKCRLINGYGPTEGTTFTCCHTISDEDSNALSIPIGHPVSNTQVYILDADLNLAPVGVAGELFIGGDGLASAYVGRPALTAEKFIPNPFSGAPGGRLYRTGDLVRMRPDGTIDFVGRADSQVKVRGFRIELGEIQSRLVERADVKEAEILCREDVPGIKSLVAYVVFKPGIHTEASELRLALSDVMPGYMVPSAIVVMDALPLTPNGKVDRQALPLPERIHGPDEDYLPPVSDREKLISGIWRDVLGVGLPGLRDNFFDLGGDSLAATRLISRIQGETGIAVSLKALFDDPTVQGLCESIEICEAKGRDPEEDDREEFSI